MRVVAVGHAREQACPHAGALVAPLLETECCRPAVPGSNCSWDRLARRGTLGAMCAFHVLVPLSSPWVGPPRSGGFVRFDTKAGNLGDQDDSGVMPVIGSLARRGEVLVVPWPNASVLGVSFNAISECEGPQANPALQPRAKARGSPGATGRPDLGCWSSGAGAEAMQSSLRVRR